jgi:hypothetical protein
MTPEQLEILEDSLYLIETRDHPFRAVYSDYRDPPHPIIQLDGHCGHTGKVGSVKTAETPLRKPTDDLPSTP